MKKQDLPYTGCPRHLQTLSTAAGVGGPQDQRLQIPPLCVADKLLEPLKPQSLISRMGTSARYTVNPQKLQHSLTLSSWSLRLTGNYGYERGSPRSNGALLASSIKIIMTKVF